MKVPCRITGSSQQDFDFVDKLQTLTPKETSNWLKPDVQTVVKYVYVYFFKIALVLRKRKNSVCECTC